MSVACYRQVPVPRSPPQKIEKKSDSACFFVGKKVEPPRDGRWLFITAPPLPCFVLGTTTEPPPPCHFAQQRQQRAMPPLCVAVHNRLSYGRNAVARLRCTPLLPPKRSHFIPSQGHACASCIFDCFMVPPSPAKTFLPTTPALSQRHCR